MMEERSHKALKATMSLVWSTTATGLQGSEGISNLLSLLMDLSLDKHRQGSTARKEDIRLKQGLQ